MHVFLGEIRFVVSRMGKVTLEQKVFRKPRPYHFNVELTEKKHVALLRFLTFSYSPLRLPAVHLRVLVSGYFIFLIAWAPQMESTLDTFLFYKLMKKPQQDSEIINVGQRS